MKKILVIGSSNIDLITTVEHFPVAGETIEGQSFTQVMGGKGANQALAAFRAGGDVKFVTSVGNDSYGQKAIQYYRDEGLNVSISKVCDLTPTGIATIWVDKKGENSIIIIPGANRNLNPEYIQKVQSEIEWADIIVMQMEIPYETVRLVCEIASKWGKKIILNAAPAYPLDDDILKSLFILLVNKSEIETITGKRIDTDGEEETIDTLLDKGVENVILTLGSKGSRFKNRNESITMPAFDVAVKDTTAAGDTFCGALTTEISRSSDIRQAMLFATAAAALCVTRLGAQPSIPDRKEIMKFIETHQS